MAKSMQASMQAQMGNNQQGGRGPGMPGMPGMAGMAGNPQGGSDKAPDFHDPRGAVQAFLDALKARDIERLTEATALHAQAEAVKHNQDIFRRIYDGSLSASELDDLAKKLEGYTIMGENPPKSTGKVDVIVSKRGPNNSMVHRIITVRHERKGWGVNDVSGPGEFKNPRMVPYGAPKRR
jgi:hypothetical protein